jgi:hypothetical protein
MRTIEVLTLFDPTLFRHFARDMSTAVVPSLCFHSNAWVVAAACRLGNSFCNGFLRSPALAASGVALPLAFGAVGAAANTVSTTTTISGAPCYVPRRAALQMVRKLVDLIPSLDVDETQPQPRVRIAGVLEHSQLHRHLTGLCGFFFAAAVDSTEDPAGAAVTVLRNLTSTVFAAAVTRGTCIGQAVRTVVGLNVALIVAQWAADAGATSNAQPVTEAADAAPAAVAASTTPIIGDVAALRAAFAALLPVLQLATSKDSAEYYTRLSESGRAVLDVLRRLPGVDASFESLGTRLKLERAVAKARADGVKELRRARMREGKGGAVVRKGKVESRRPNVVNAKRDATPVMKTSSGKRPPIKKKKGGAGAGGFAKKAGMKGKKF